MRFDWPFFWAQLVDPGAAFLEGLGLTVLMAVCAQALASGFGLLLAFARMSARRRFRWPAAVYIWVVRGTPLLVQIVFIYTGLAAANVLRFNDITLAGVTLPGSVQAGIAALAINEAAYMAEIFRAGIQAVEPGQAEAARALGMSPFLTMRRIVLPQALRISLLPIGNQFNAMLKNTTLVSVIGVSEMLLVTETINSATFMTFELYAVLAIYFLALTSLWNLVMGWAERRYPVRRPAVERAARAG